MKFNVSGDDFWIDVKVSSTLSFRVFFNYHGLTFLKYENGNWTQLYP